jgi:hypothetical protein
LISSAEIKSRRRRRFRFREHLTVPPSRNKVHPRALLDDAAVSADASHFSE